MHTKQYLQNIGLCKKSNRPFEEIKKVTMKVAIYAYDKEPKRG